MLKKSKLKTLIPLLLLFLIFISSSRASRVMLIPIAIVALLLFKMKSFKFNKKKKSKKEDVIVNVPGFDLSKKLKPYFIFYLIVIIAVLYYFRPWIHGFVMAFYTKPLLLLFVAFLVIGGLAFLSKKRQLASLFIGLAVITFFLLPFTTIIEQRYIVYETEYNKIDSLPDTSDVRILPRVVAFRYLEDSLQKSREKVGGINIVNVDGDIFWMAPRVPDGFILYLTQKVNGVMTADATKTDRTTKLITKKLNIGEDIGIFDNIYWNLFKKRYFVNFGDIYYIYKNDRIVTIAPIIAYKFKFPVMIPYYAGIMALDEEGGISYYNPEQVKEHITDNRAYPGELARLYVDSYKYNLGIINAWFLHEDQIEISDVYGLANRQPFLIPTTDGLKWIIATEPVGESYGVFKIFLVDALTGRIDMLELDEDQTLTGPVRVVSYVKKKFPRIDWSTTRIVEPRPFVINKKLYWMLSITPNDFAGIAYTVFVNSENNEVIAFEDDEGVYDFVKEGVAEEFVSEEVEGKTKEEMIDDKLAEIEKILEEIRNLE